LGWLLSSREIGDEAEGEVASHARSRGWKVVRSLGSRTPCDMLISRPPKYGGLERQAFMYQIKSTGDDDTYYIDPSELRDLSEHAAESGNEPRLAVKFGDGDIRVYNIYSLGDRPIDLLLHPDRRGRKLIRMEKGEGTRLEDVF
jgi:Holliday junction resolvase